MRRKPSSSKKTTTKKPVAAKSMAGVAFKRASIFRNGSNQAVRLPQELKFPENVREVRVRKQGDGLLLSPVRPDWSSFFALEVDVPDDFLAERNDSPPQPRDPL
jgi:antitoxin VapB